MSEDSLLRPMGDRDLRMAVEELIRALVRLETASPLPKSNESERTDTINYIIEIYGFLGTVSNSEAGLVLNTLPRLGRALLDLEQGVQPPPFLRREWSRAKQGAPPLGVFHHEIRADAVSGSNMLKAVGVSVDQGCTIVAQEMKRLKIDEFFPRANREFSAKTVKNWRRKHNTPVKERADQYVLETLVLAYCGVDQSSKISAVRRYLSTTFNGHMSGLFNSVPEPRDASPEDT